MSRLQTESEIERVRDRERETLSGGCEQMCIWAVTDFQPSSHAKASNKPMMMTMMKDEGEPMLRVYS